MPRRRILTDGSIAPDHLRCCKNDGSRWRCAAYAMPGSTFCEHHLRRRIGSGGARPKQSSSTPSSTVPPDSPTHGRCRRRTVPSACFCESHLLARGKRATIKHCDPSPSPSDPPAVAPRRRCRKTDGEQWRCPERAMPGVTFCELHQPLNRRAEAKINSSSPPSLLSVDPPTAPSRRRRVKTEAIECQWADNAFSGAKVCEHSDKQVVHDETQLTQPLPSRLGVDIPEVPDNLRCRRNDGRDWRCRNRAMPCISFCEHHYLQVCRNQAKLKQQQPLREPRQASSPNSMPRRKRRKMGDMPEEGELIAAALRRQVVKREKRGRRVTIEAEEAVVPADVMQELPNGVMTISPVALASGNSVQECRAGSLVERKLGFESDSLLRRCIRSKNVESLPVGSVKRSPWGKGLRKCPRKTCHRCQKSKLVRIVRCLNCRKSFCSSCIKQWYPELSKMEIKLCCPICRGCCSCEKCSLAEETDAVCKDDGSDQAKPLEIKYVDYLLHQLLPVLNKFNQEQLDELELEAKLQEAKISAVRIQVASNCHNELATCHYCKVTILHFLRICTKCSYKLCLSCCQKIREGNLFKKDPLDTSDQDKAKRMHEHGGSTLDRKKHGLSTTPLAYNSHSDSSTLPLLESKGSEGSISCPPIEFGGCGTSFLSLIYMFPVGWPEELNLDEEQKAFCLDYFQKIDAPPHCSSKIFDDIDKSDQLAISARELGISAQEAMAC